MSACKLASRVRRTIDGLRDYGTATWVGGDIECDHIETISLKRNHSGGLSVSEGLGRGYQSSTKSSSIQYRDFCGKCGSSRIDAQIGLEARPSEYVVKLVEVFREVRRVLKDDGLLWLNLGDSFSKKQIQMIPARVAIALQDDGWYLRQEIVWSKKAPMPESVTDRCTRSHEMVYMLAKQQRYYYDAASIAEPASQAGRVRNDRMGGSKYSEGVKHSDGFIFPGSEMRNKRSVWTFGPEPYADAHFACYPTSLVKPMVMASTRMGDVVLDPFAGSGTTAKVALELGRKSIAIELNPSYCALIEQRTNVTPGML